MKTIIKENQRGLLTKNGRFTDYLLPGKHVTLGSGTKIRIVDLDYEFTSELDVFLTNAKLRADLSVVDVPDLSVALHFVNGRFSKLLTSGKYAYFNIYDKHEFRIIDVTSPEVSADVPRYIFAVLPKSLYFKIEVAEYQKARLSYDKKPAGLLDSGTYYFWNNGTRIEASLVDTRALSMDVAGQEIMTLDKVGLRVNLVCSYKIVDYIRIQTEIDDYERQMHILLQLALREYIGSYRLDEILENKDKISAHVLSRLRASEQGLFVKFLDAGVKDIILPGEIRDIMNTVLVAEKKAQANVIARREEVASTRSLLNTAKLMEENQTLYKLKELEALEKICAGVGNISLSGGNDLLGQLTNLIRGAQ
jgi:regulator of protease activity HflC (stomatin/prohibitin superfamily)